MNEKLNKARRLLDYKKYHLCEKYNGIDSKWELFEKYETWMEDGSKPIMTSENNTDDELLKFAKNHKKYILIDIVKILNVFVYINLLISIVNTILKLKYLSLILIGNSLTIILLLIIIDIMNFKNFNVEHKERIRCFQRERKRMYKGL